MNEKIAEIAEELRKRGISFIIQKELIKDYEKADYEVCLWDLNEDLLLFLLNKCIEYKENNNESWWIIV